MKLSRLRQLSTLPQRIEDIEEAIEVLKSKRERITTEVSGMPNGSPNRDKLLSQTIQIEELIVRKNDKTIYLEGVKQEFCDFVGGLSITEAEVCRVVYEQGVKPSEAHIEVGCSYATPYNVIRRMIESGKIEM